MMHRHSDECRVINICFEMLRVSRTKIEILQEKMNDKICCTSTLYLDVKCSGYKINDWEIYDASSFGRMSEFFTSFQFHIHISHSSPPLFFMFSIDAVCMIVDSSSWICVR
jgi:hypothetical protein